MHIRPISPCRSRATRGDEPPARGMADSRDEGGARAEPSSKARSTRKLLARLAEEGTSSAGFALIEVIVAALLVGLIVAGTFDAFVVANRASANQRQHNQATLIADQDEERLRGEQLTKLTQTGHETKAVPEGGTTYTVESLAEYITQGTETDALTCNTSSGVAESIKTTSIVSWVEGARGATTRKSIKQSSIVSVPSSTTVEARVVNQAGEPVSGATVTVKGTSTNVSQTTLATGCVIFGSIGEKTVELGASKSGFVSHSGSATLSKTVTLSSSATTSEEFALAEGATLNTEFDTNGGATRGLTGDTVYIGQSNVGTPPNFIAGKAGTYVTATSLSGLFPFVSPNTYTVFAGDCEKNNPETVISGGSAKDEKVLLEPGATKTVTVEEPQVNELVMSGTSASSPGTTVTSTSAKLINKECASTSAQNYTTVPYEHVTEIVAGRLKPRYAPYAKSLELCVAWLEGGKYYKNKTTFANATKAGSTELTFYAKGTGVTSSTTVLTC
jgi:Tfp pilus assembly protein PilV